MSSEATIRIGKTVIETLTQGMYEDARFIFREYVQNACDAIDKAVRNNALEDRKAGEIFIEVDKNNRTITFEDNGCGIEQNNVFALLGNIALSEKDRTKDKGFRGIGRLGGLGYCDTLVFETSVVGETRKTIMTWDAESLRQKLFDKNVIDDASAIVKSIISIKYENADADEHYFKVVLNGIDDDDLLDTEDIKEYLSMVIPIPYDTPFYYKSKIYEYAKSIQNEIDEYCVYLNGDRLYKPYKTMLYKETDDKGTLKKIDEIIDIEIFDIKSGSELLAWGWYGISEFNGALSKCNPFRCIRLRKGNIQIGNEQTLLDHKMLREDRSNTYFVGEIFCIHTDLIPNSRRDYFNENAELKTLEQSLKDLFNDTLHSLYYTASNLRGAYKKINKVVEIQEELEKKEQVGFIGDEKETLVEQLTNAHQKAIDSAKKIERIERTLDNSDNNALSSVVAHIKKEYYKEIIIGPIITDESQKPQKAKHRTDSLSRLSKEQRRFLERIFVIIKKNLPPPQAEELIQKIEEELK